MRVLLILAITALTVASCKKNEAPTPSEYGEASLSGVITADLNQTNDTVSNPFAAPSYEHMRIPEYPPSANLTCVIDEEDLQYNPVPGFTYDKLSFTVPINPIDGTYSVTLPSINRPVPVQLYFDEFNHDMQVIYLPQPDSIVWDYNHRYTLGDPMEPISINIVTGGSYVYNGTYY